MIEKPRVLGLDVGEKRIGMAISDPMGWSAQPIETLHRTKLEKDLDQIQKWVDHYKAKKNCSWSAEEYEWYGGTSRGRHKRIC